MRANFTGDIYISPLMYCSQRELVVITSEIKWTPRDIKLTDLKRMGWGKFDYQPKERTVSDEERTI